MLPKYHPVGRIAYSLVTAVDTPDPYTAVVRLKAPFGPFVFMTALNTGAIVPKHLLAGQDITTAEFNRKPVGTGPFKIAEAVKGSHYVLERNPDYFKKGQPYLDRVVLRVMPNPASRVLAFEKGEVDVLYSFFLPVEQAGRVKALPGVVVKEYMLFPEVITLFFNLKDTKALGRRARAPGHRARHRQEIPRREGLLRPGPPGHQPDPVEPRLGAQPQGAGLRLRPGEGGGAP